MSIRILLGILSGLLVTLVAGGVYGAAPPYPEYNVQGQVGGSTNQIWKSNAVGSVDANAVAHRNFHYLTFNSTWDATQLKFKYRCVFKATTNPPQFARSGTVNDGTPCPPGGAGASHYVKAISVELDGPEKANYQLEYDCWIAYKGQPHESYFGPKKAGEYCGNETGGAPDEWITRLRVTLSPR